MSNAIQVNNQYNLYMIPYIWYCTILKIEIRSTNGFVPNDFLQQLNTLVESHNANGMCISVWCHQNEGQQSEALHMPGLFAPNTLTCLL